MKSYITLLFAVFFLVSCTKQDVKETTLLDFTPNNPSVVIYTPSIHELQEELESNSFLSKFKNTKTYSGIAKEFQFLKNLKSDNPALISYAKVGKSLEFLMTIKNKDIQNDIDLHSKSTSYNNKNYQKLKQQNAFSIVLDSTLVITSSEILIENLIRNTNANIRYSNKSLLKLYGTSDNSKTTAFINLEKKPQFLNGVFPSEFLANNNWVAAELNHNNGISINGIATNTETQHEIARHLNLASTEKSHSSSIIPANFTEYTSYNFEELKLNSEFENFDELVDGSTEIVSFLDGKNQLCAFKLLNTTISDELTEHSTYRNHTIYTNTYFKIPAKICNPQPHLAIYIDDFLILSNSIDGIQNCISHYQNKTTLQHQNSYTENAEALLSEAHIVKGQQTNIIKNSLAALLNDESIKNVKLTDFPLTMHQVTYEDSYVQFNSVIKKVTKQQHKTNVSQISSITLDADLTSEIQWVTNHRTQQKELLVQDVNNQLYLIANNGTIIWKKQLKSKLQGKVIQVDLFKNKKLQLAFTTENEFLVLDRNGEIVDQFHKTFKDGNLLPLAVFDYDNNRNYRFVITQDNTVMMFDNKFKTVKGFKFNTAKSTIIETPKHIRIGTKDYITIAESNGQLHILNRQGQPRTTVNSTFEFKANTILQKQANSVVFQDQKNVVTQVNIATGKVSKSDILQGNSNYYTTRNNFSVKLEDEKISINNKTTELDLGTYTAPVIIYFNKTYYISVTDIDTRTIYLFDSKAHLLEQFPVYGQSEISATNMDADKRLEFAVKGESNSILIYKM